jgi:hypothetical protein
MSGYNTHMIKPGCPFSDPVTMCGLRAKNAPDDAMITSDPGSLTCLNCRHERDGFYERLAKFTKGTK